MTTIKEQAERWARRKADIYGAEKAIITIYDMRENYTGLSVKFFEEDLIEWIHAGIWDKERALREMKVYPDYDQIAFISQRAINQILYYKSFYEVIV